MLAASGPSMRSRLRDSAELAFRAGNGSAYAEPSQPLAPSFFQAAFP